MRAEVTADSMGYDVRLSAADRLDFARLLDLFKGYVVEAHRRYDTSAKLWRVEKRAQSSLQMFIHMAEAAGAKVMQTTQPRAVMTMEAMARPAHVSNWLTVADTDDSGQVLAYRAKQKAAKLPAVIVCRHVRFASLRATVYGSALKDEAKRLCFDYLMAGSEPNSLVRVSNRELACTKMTYHLAAEMAAWLYQHLSNPHNIIAGVMDGREHARLEATKQNDGRVKMRQGARRAA